MSEISFSVGISPASLFAVALTITMTFMPYSLLRGGSADGLRYGVADPDSTDSTFPSGISPRAWVDSTKTAQVIDRQGPLSYP
jgi:hypothetical protein